MSPIRRIRAHAYTTRHSRAVLMTERWAARHGKPLLAALAEIGRDEYAQACLLAEARRILSP